MTHSIRIGTKLRRLDNTLERTYLAQLETNYQKLAIKSSIWMWIISSITLINRLSIKVGNPPFQSWELFLYTVEREKRQVRNNSGFIVKCMVKSLHTNLTLFSAKNESRHTNIVRMHNSLSSWSLAETRLIYYLVLIVLATKIIKARFSLLSSSWDQCAISIYIQLNSKPNLRITS